MPLTACHIPGVMMLKHDSDLLPEDARMGLFTPVFDNLVTQLAGEILAGRDSPKGGCAAHTTALVFGAIWRHTQKRYHVCFATQSTLARQAGICIRSIRYHIRRLEGLGYVEDTTPDLRNRSHYYRITEKGWLLASRAGDEKTHRQKLPPDSSAKVTDEETLQETSLKKSLPDDLIPQKLKAATPEAVKLFSILAEEFEVIGQPAPLCFENLAQKRKFEAAEDRLNGSTALAIESAILSIKPLTLQGIVNYAARFTPKPPKEEAGDQTPAGMEKVVVITDKGSGRIEYRPKAAADSEEQAHLRRLGAKIDRQRYEELLAEDKADRQRYEALLEEDKATGEIVYQSPNSRSQAIAAAWKSKARPLETPGCVLDSQPSFDPQNGLLIRPGLRSLHKEKELRGCLKTMLSQATYDSLFGLAHFYEDEGGEIFILAAQHSFENLDHGRFNEQIKRAVEVVYEEQRPVKFELRESAGAQPPEEEGPITAAGLAKLARLSR